MPSTAAFTRQPRSARRPRLQLEDPRDPETLPAFVAKDALPT